ncbi:glycosyltransferase family 2 protein [Brevibacillus sp. B_LB10_24]|uniref:glycosyltransferase family 2 protein n=1 Tax=Brevibacillus sp. B_LB10_24 TaxID=3380645 RepID=UPI0038BA0F0C
MLVSVVILAQNAVDRLLYSLQSFNLQYTPFDQFEVVVVDNASTDGTRERVEEFSAHYQLRPVCLQQPQKYSELLYEGVKAARGDLLIFSGANMIVPRSFVGTHIQAHRQKEKIILVGTMYRRVYSVFYPNFSERQKSECLAWLQDYPQIKRPHTMDRIVPLLDEKQVETEYLTEIGLTGKETDEWEEPHRRNDTYSDDEPWRLFQTQHLSVEKSAFQLIRQIPPASNQAEANRRIGFRLFHAGYTFQLSDKLVGIYQEYPQVQWGAGRQTPQEAEAELSRIEPEPPPTDPPTDPLTGQQGTSPQPVSHVPVYPLPHVPIPQHSSRQPGRRSARHAASGKRKHSARRRRKRRQRQRSRSRQKQAEGQHPKRKSRSRRERGKHSRGERKKRKKSKKKR